MPRPQMEPDWDAAAFFNRIRNADALAELAQMPTACVDLIVADPPYGLGKDYGNDSDKLDPEEYLAWTTKWLDLALPRLKPSGSLYIFLTWRNSPEIFSALKKRMLMLNEIIWDRRVPSMGGGTRRFSSVHDTIGFFALGKDYYFNIDAVRIPYDAETKKARSRSIFEGSKWLENGYNPKDVWSVSRLHREHRERVDHPTQKPIEIVERMIKASCPPGGVVLDPFLGSGTTALAALKCGAQFIGFELNPAYCRIAEQRLEEWKRPPGSSPADSKQKRRRLEQPAASTAEAPDEKPRQSLLPFTETPSLEPPTPPQPLGEPIAQ